jgi:hypothetical protein
MAGKLGSLGLRPPMRAGISQPGGLAPRLHIPKQHPEDAAVTEGQTDRLDKTIFQRRHLSHASKNGKGEACGRDYNEVRPHSASGNKTPIVLTNRSGSDDPA